MTLQMATRTGTWKSRSQGYSAISSSFMGCSFLKLEPHNSFSLAVVYATHGTPNPLGLAGHYSVLPWGISAVMKRARLWLDQCLKEHTACSSEAESELPTRVLDLDTGNPDSVRLRETQGERARYMCLSYCWGRSKFLRTVKGNLERHKQGISLAEMPLTFRHVIQITRKFGVRYLWIDSLCIIQDDDADWRREAARMADIFRNSYLTVAPTWAESANDGCFPPPDRRGTVQIGQFSVDLVPHFWIDWELDSKRRADFPMLTRGWVYQERMLSPRILHFGRQEMLWECREHRTCECGRMRFLVYETSIGGFRKMMSQPESGDHDDLQNLWRKMVVEYTALELTVRTDRLPALAGLATAVRRRRRQEYLAGLWRDTLAPDMCWFLRDPSLRPPEPGAVRRKPTWSWASVDGPVDYPYMLNHNGAVRDVYVDVLEAKCASPTSPTPQQDEQFVELRCVLIPARVKGIKLVMEALGKSYKYYPDWESETEEQDCYVIPLLRLRWGWSVPMLIVRPTAQGSQEMFRMGFAEIGDDSEDLCDMITEQTERGMLKRVKIV
ncbi:hypothetical protein VTH06DRAFT_6443 [Thermothelomyces fergusii]